jgi:hypothetical protein
MILAAVEPETPADSKTSSRMYIQYRDTKADEVVVELYPIEPELETGDQPRVYPGHFVIDNTQQPVSAPDHLYLFKIPVAVPFMIRRDCTVKQMPITTNTMVFDQMTPGSPIRPAKKTASGILITDAPMPR